MPDKKSETPIAESVRDVLIEDEMKDSYLNYAMSVIVSRALPDIRDGLKPSQRRILVAMHDLNLGPHAKYRKCAKICGDTTGNYHPHGDQVVYPTLVRMAQEFSCRYQLVDGQGNFGSLDGDPPAAMRYTEARMTEFSTLLMEDIDKNTVNFTPNYDETREEPTVLPGKFPNLICNGATGIAVGMATSIPPHNLGEVCDAIIKIIDKPDITTADLLKIIKGPDFPTGGLVYGMKGMKDAYETGRGIVTVRAKLHTEEVKGGRINIVVTEIPYNQNKAKIIETIAELVKEDRIKGISDIRDESDKDGIRVVIEVKKGEEEQVVINQLYKQTSLQDSFSIIMIALVNNRPQTLPLKQILKLYIDHRMEVIKRRTKFLLDKAEAEAHILEGLLIALRNIDEVIETIKKSQTVEIAEANLVSKFKLTPIQAQAILRMQLSKLTGLETEKLQKQLAELMEKIRDYKAILADDQMVLDIIREDIYEIKEKYADKRRTEIVGSEIGSMLREDLIADEDMAVIMTHAGYIKRMHIDSYRKQNRGGKGVSAIDTKEGDFIEHIFVASTHDYILFFTDLGKVYWQKVYDLPELSRGSKGRAIVNILSLSEGEQTTAAIPVRDFSSGYIVMATEKGIIKKTLLQEYGNPRKAGIIALTLDDGDKLIGVKLTSGENHILLGTEKGLSIRFPEEKARSIGRTSRGVCGIRLREGDKVKDLAIVDEEPTLLTVCRNGYGKRTAFDEYRLQGRGGKGIINIKTTERNGIVVGMKPVSDKDDVMVITQEGMVVRTPVKSVRSQSRNTQGVRIISLSANDKVVSIAVVEHEDDDEKTSAAPIAETSIPEQPNGNNDTTAAPETPEAVDNSDTEDIKS